MDASRTPEVGKVTAAEMLALLRSIEWGAYPDECETCPQCEGCKPGSKSAREYPRMSGHQSECELGSMIRRLEAEQSGVALGESAKAMHSLVYVQRDQAPFEPMVVWTEGGVLRGRSPKEGETPNAELRGGVIVMLTNIPAKEP